MCQALKELIEEGRMEGQEEAVRGIVLKMVKKGRTDEEILELTECGVQMIWEVRKVAERKLRL